jgi:Ni/Co efflux regulator RcnB
MKVLGITALALAVVAPNMAAADPWKDESGKGRWRDGYPRFDRDWDDDRKVKFRTADGCEIERKFKKGEYEEKVKCKPGR